MPDRVTFSEFMRSALYDEQRGYYMTDRSHFGRAGDFNTTSQFHELFGQLMAGEFARVFGDVGTPSTFTIVELGPGDGDFACHVLVEMKARYPATFARLRYVCCEVSQVLRSRQFERLRAFSCVEWIASLEEIDQPVSGVFFSNEFFDALPVHIIRDEQGALVEVYVARGADGNLFFDEDELSHPDLLKFWRRAGAALSDGQLAEISLEAVEYLRLIATKLASGSVITIDYGDVAESLYDASRRDGTLRCFSEHRLSDEPLERIGQQDMTASVNFSALIDYGAEFGLNFVSFGSAIDYLTRLGLLRQVAKAGEGANEETTGALEHRLALKQLFVPGGIASHFKVLVQVKG